jgi:hypothetical protein
MPLSDDNDLGVNADGSANGDYCAYCYQNGAFTRDVTMEGMIDLCLPFLAGANRDKTEEQIRAALRQWFPSLKRWEGAARGE